MKIEDYIKNYITSKDELEHANYVSNLSLKLYSELNKIFPENQFLKFDNAQTLISYSALLHDVGNFFGGLNAKKPHNKTGAKLVLENKIDNLKEDEVKIIAASIRYHRGSKPKDGKHKLYSSLKQEDKNTVLLIASIIRIADSLDRFHMQTAQNIVLTYDFDNRILTLNPGVNITFNGEIKRVFNKKKTLFEDVFRLKIYLKNE